MIIKKKSLIVALISSIVISSVLVLTLVGYVMYIELKGEEFKRSYVELLRKANAKFYSKYVEVSKLSAALVGTGALRGRPIIEGLVKNTGYKDIADLLMKVKFLDRDGAVIYEVVFHPQEPSLGSASLTQGLAIPYLSSPSRLIIKYNDSMPFKKILTNCPKEILEELKKGAGFAKSRGRWSGTLSFEVLSLDF